MDILKCANSTYFFLFFGPIYWALLFLFCQTYTDLLPISILLCFYTHWAEFPLSCCMLDDMLFLVDLSTVCEYSAP